MSDTMIEVYRECARQENRAIQAEKEVEILKKQLAYANSSVEWQAKRADGWRQRVETLLAGDKNDVVLENRNYINQLEKVYIAVVQHCGQCSMESDEALSKAVNETVMPKVRL